MSTVDSSNKIGRQLVGVIRVLVTALLGGIGAAAGFSHTHDWAVHHGQTGWLAWADAVVIEGMAIVAGFEVHRDHHRPGPRRKVSFPILVLVAGFGIQMAAQVALAEPTPPGWLLAAMPALGFLVVVKLLMRRAPTTDHPTPAPAPVADRSTPEPPAARPAPPTVAPEPAPVAAAPGPASRLKLPPEMTTRITAVMDEVRREGRDMTTDDIRRAVKVPDAMAAQIVADLSIHNGHTFTA
jgi:hypothetical protein